MNEKKIKEIWEKMNFQSGSKLSISSDDSIHLIYEIKKLNNISALFFLYMLIQKLIEEDIVDKEILLDLINNFL